MGIRNTISVIALLSKSSAVPVKFKFVNVIAVILLPLNYAGANVVTVPDEPRHFNAPASENITPPPVGFVVGITVALASPKTFVPLPNWLVV